MDDKELAQWTEDFKIVGNPIRLLALLAIYASDTLARPNHSLTYSEIKGFAHSYLDESTPIEDTLAHHLKVLEDKDFIKKEARMENGRVFPVYKAGSAGHRFLEDAGLKQLFADKLKELSSK